MSPIQVGLPPKGGYISGLANRSSQNSVAGLATEVTGQLDRANPVVLFRAEHIGGATHAFSDKVEADEGCAFGAIHQRVLENVPDVSG